MNYAEILMDAQIAAIRAGLAVVKAEGECGPYGQQTLIAKRVNKKNKQFLETACNMGLYSGWNDTCMGLGGGWWFDQIDRTGSKSFKVSSAATDAFIEVLTSRGINLEEMGICKTIPVTLDEFKEFIRVNNIRSKRQEAHLTITRTKEEMEPGMYPGYYDSFVVSENGLVSYGGIAMARHFAITVSEGDERKIQYEKNLFVNNQYMENELLHYEDFRVCR